MKLISTIRPFDAKQVIYIMDNTQKEEIDIRTTSLEDFDKTIIELTELYPEINYIKLRGNVDFCAKIKTNITQAEINKYNQNKLTIDITGE